MNVYIVAAEDRETLFRDILDGHFKLHSLPACARPGPAAGDTVLVDLAGSAGDWEGKLSDLGRDMEEGVRLVAVLRLEQVRSLNGRVHLDDFITEGSPWEEVGARLRRLALGEDGTSAAAGELEVDADRYEVRVGGARVELTYKEFELLRFLAARPGRVFTREALLEQVWGYDYFGGSRTVDVHIRRIRSKIERKGHTYIRTVRGVGYIFEHLSPG